MAKAFSVDWMLPPGVPRNDRSRAMLSLAIIAILLLTSPQPILAHGDLHGQIQEVTRRIGLEPRNAELYLGRGELYRAHQDFDAAQADYDRAFALDPKLDVIDFVRGRLFLEANWPLSARIALDRFLARHSNNVEALVARARTLVKLENRLAAAEDYTKAIQFTTESRPELYLERAQALAGEGGPHTKEAVQGLDEGIKKLGPLVTLQLGALDLEVQAKHYDDALTRIDSIMAKMPRKESWLARKADILQQAGRTDEARSAIEAALKSMETLPAGRRNVPAMIELEKRLRDQLAGLK